MASSASALVSVKKEPGDEDDGDEATGFDAAFLPVPVFSGPKHRCVRSGWDGLKDLMTLQAQVKATLPKVQTGMLTLERECVVQQMDINQVLCEACHLIRDPRERKLLFLREFHLHVLQQKSPDLQCTAGMFARLEKMVIEGAMDAALIPNAPRCYKCRQMTDIAKAKERLLIEVSEIFRDDLHVTHPSSECSMSQACLRCLHYVVLAMPAANRNNHAAADQEQPSSSQEKTAVTKTEIQPEMLEQLHGDLDKLHHIVTQDIGKKVKRLEPRVLSNRLMINSNKRDFDKMMEGNTETLDKINKRLKETEIQIKLSSLTFSGEPWKNPYYILSYWRNTLTSLQVPKGEWTRYIATLVLRGQAEYWWSFHLPDNAKRDWEGFATHFLNYYKRKEHFTMYFKCCQKKIRESSQFVTDEEIINIFHMFQHALRDDKKLLAIFMNLFTSDSQRSLQQVQTSAEILRLLLKRHGDGVLIHAAQLAHVLGSSIWTEGWKM